MAGHFSLFLRPPKQLPAAEVPIRAPDTPRAKLQLKICQFHDYNLGSFVSPKMPALNGWFYAIMERLYTLPEPPVRKRAKPLEIICVGLPRTGTESLKHALHMLGYDYTYHGWDIDFETPNYAQKWVELCQKKYFGPMDGNTTLTAEDFDRVMGHAVAVTDFPASVFATELVAAYPSAKIILNGRSDLEAWHESMANTLARAPRMWHFWSIHLLSRECFWCYHCFVRYMIPGLFRALDGDTETGMMRNGKWVYKEHHAMVHGLVPKDRLLEWSVEDGWDPLCEFLGKPVPDEPFPHANSTAGFPGQEEKLLRRWVFGAARNLAVMVGISVAVGAVGYQAYKREGFGKLYQYVQGEVITYRLLPILGK